MAGSVDGKVVLITGAGDGIGRAAALEFAREGANVVVADVHASRCRETLEMIEQNSARGLCVKADVSKAAEVEDMIAQAVKEFGRLDCAVNNAGIMGTPAPTAECTEENWDHVISVNLKGVWLCMKYEIRQMLKQGKGAIVNVSSCVGLVGWPGTPAYVASKHAVSGLTKGAALEYAAQGIRINAVCPAVIRTPFMERAIAADPAGALEGEKRRVALLPIGRMGTPQEVAAAILWLCTDAAAYVVGHNLSVDGGFVAC